MERQLSWENASKRYFLLIVNYNIQLFTVYFIIISNSKKDYINVERQFFTCKKICSRTFYWKRVFLVCFPVGANGGRKPKQTIKACIPTACSSVSQLQPPGHSECPAGPHLGNQSSCYLRKRSN